MLGAVGLLVKAVGLHVAVGLWAPGGVLRSNDHGDGIVDGENNERKEHSSHKESLR